MAVSKGDVNRLFLQAFLSRRVMTDAVAKILHKKCIAAAKSVNEDIEMDPNFDAFFARIRDSIANLQNGMEVQSMQDEVTGTAVHTITNIRGDELAQLATEYTAAEIAFFKLIVDQIITAPNESFSISDFAALRERENIPGGTKITVSHAEALVDSFVARGWLSKSRRSRYSLAPRAIIELTTYISKNYEDEEDLKVCSICDVFVFKGLRCRGNAGKCQVKVHRPCFTRWSERAKTNNRSAKCTVCDYAWSDEKKMKVVGEEAVADGVVEPRRRRGNPKGKRGSQRDAADSDEIAMESEEEIDIDGYRRSQATQVKKEKATGRKGNASRTTTGRKSRRQQEDEEDDAMGSPDDSEPLADDSLRNEDDDDSETPPPVSTNSRSTRRSTRR